MSNIQKIENKKGRIKDLSNNSLAYKILFEFIGSFVLIFLIDIVFSLGELNSHIWFMNIFRIIYKINLFAAMWIATMTFVAFLIFEKTSITSNSVTLIIQYKNKKIEKDTLVFSVTAQFLGGIISSLFVYFIMMGFAIWLVPTYNSYNDFISINHTMGGSSVYLRGFITNGNIDQYKFYNLYSSIDFSSLENKGTQFGFSAIQGIINAFIISISFIIISFVEKKYNRNVTKKTVRYIMLIVLISISIIISANTTNWDRLISPAIINAIFTNNITGVYRIGTTLTFIFFQTFGLIFILLSDYFIK